MLITDMYVEADKKGYKSGNIVHSKPAQCSDKLV